MRFPAMHCWPMVALAALPAWAGDMVVFPRNMAVTVEFANALRVSGADVGVRDATLLVRRADGRVCSLNASFALVSDTGVLIGRGNSLKCPESEFERQVKGQLVDPRSGSGAFRGYCVARAKAGTGDDYADNPCVAVVIPAHTKAYFLFKREIVL